MRESAFYALRQAKHKTDENQEDGKGSRLGPLKLVARKIGDHDG